MAAFALGGSMKCVVLQNADGGHLGFMLCTPGLDQPSGHCSFVPLPARPELFDTPAAGLLFARREAGESTWQVTSREPVSAVVRTPGLAAELFIELDSRGPGRWGEVSGAGRQVVGRALLATPTEPGATVTGPKDTPRFSIASRGRRLLAYVLDVIPFVGATFILFYAFSDFDAVLGRYRQDPANFEARVEFLWYRNWIRDLALLGYIAYSWIADSSRFQGTFGKRLLGIRVVDEHGHRLDRRRSAIRNDGKILSAVPLFLGFIWILFREDRRGWHDLMARTYVVDA